MYMYHACAWHHWRSEGGIGSPKTRVTDDCKPPCVCWELNLGSSALATSALNHGADFPASLLGV